MSRSIRKGAALALSVAALALCAGKAPDTIVHRQGLTVEQLEVDAHVCLAEAKAAEKGRSFASSAYLSGSQPGSQAAALSASAVAGLLKGMDDMQRFMAAHDACLSRLGYDQIQMNPEQRAAFGKLKTQRDRSLFIVQAGEDWDRVQAAR
jgi:hypothetical protein